jgi:uncharacterized repeat protein (TIGR01451 family)
MHIESFECCEKGAFMALAAAVLVVACLAGQAHAGELVQNSGFETGGFGSSWVHGAGNTSGTFNPSWADHDVVLDLPHNGNYSALLGFKYTPQYRWRFGFMYQDVTIPSGVSSATLYFKFRQQGYDGLQYDPFTVTIRDLSNNVLATVVSFAFSEWNNLFKDSGWIDDDGVGPVGYDMSAYAGQTVRIYFRQENSYDDLYETWVFVDDVSLVFTRFIDLAVDGDGDDAFGNLGTGAGGSSLKSGEEGETISYMLDIENEGTIADSYQLSLSPPAGWTAVIRYGGTDYAFPWTTPVLPAGTTIQAEVLLTIPPGEPVGGYSAILDAVSTADGTRFDSVYLGANVVPASHRTDLAIDANGFGVIDPDGGGGISFREAPPDSQVTYLIELLNDGVQADSFRIWFRPQSPLGAVIEEGAIIHTGAFFSGTLAAGSSALYTLRVTIPPGTGEDDYETIVYAMSRTDTLRKDAVTAVTRVRAPKVDIIISGSGDDIIDLTGSGLGGSSTIAGTPGSTLNFPLIVQNESALPDSFTFDWTPPGGGWTAVINDGTTDHAFPWTTPEFTPFSEAFYVLSVTIPAGASYDTYISILDAVSSIDGAVSESVTAGIAVSSGNEVDLIIDGDGADAYGPLGTGLGGSSLQAASPGDTVYFDIVVENEGGEDLFDLQWTTPPGWEVVIGDSTATMRSVPSGTYTLEVRIPASSSGGTFDIIFDGMKTNKNFFVDSARARVVVTPPSIVDALIDGDGNELFGTPGAGDGGYSMQSTIAGRTVSFTLELENQGADTESYTVTWNSFPGWITLLDGSASPFVTPSIGAGASMFFTFEVTIPQSATSADYDYIIDVVSNDDPLNVESVTARVHINPPPQIDLVIEGDGAFVTAPAGTGGGGRGLVFGDLGTEVTAVLEVHNRGGFPDSFRIIWQEPVGWPAGSVLLSDGSNDFTSPYVTNLIEPDSSLTFTVRIFIPADANLRSSFLMDAEALSLDFEDSILLEIVTSMFITGYVFNDADHDGIYDAGEAGIGGVVLTLEDPGGDIVSLTNASGSYTFEVPPGLVRQLIETTPSGMVSLSPDTVSTGPGVAGDTIRVDFADVPASVIVPELVRNAPAGGVVDFPHTITAGTPGQATLFAVLPAGWAEVFYRDNNADGLLDAGDTRLTAADLDLDPAVPGRDVVPVIMRVFVPPQAPAGTSESIIITLEQTLSGTAIVVSSTVTDRVLVLAQASGLLSLQKDVDLAQARPGDVITYTVTFSNPGTEAIQEIEIFDPVSADVDFVADAFGPGQDIEWTTVGGTVYLTADPADADEAMLDPATGTLRIICSRQNPFVMNGGEVSTITYRVRIK